jgi:hypothetical protein
VAERNGLLNRRTGYTVPWVRIPPSPQKRNSLYGLSAAAERLFVLSGPYKACFVKGREGQNVIIA